MLLSIISNTASATAEHAAAADGGKNSPIRTRSSSTTELKIAKQAIIEMIHCDRFEAVESDTLYNRTDKIAA